MKKNYNLMKKLDIMIQKTAENKLSQISNSKNCIAHHLIGRKNYLFRYDLRNLMYITKEEHYHIHFTLGYKEKYYTQKQKDFIEENKNKDWHHCDLEFMQIKEKELIAVVGNEKMPSIKLKRKAPDEYKKSMNEYKRKQAKKYYQILKEFKKQNKPIK